MAKMVMPVVEVRAYGPVDAAKPASCATNSKPSGCVQPLHVEIVDKISLPAESTDAGILARVILAESLSPTNVTAYGDGKDVLQAMRSMRAVLENRLKATKTSPVLKSYVGCNPSTLDFRGIVFANQCGANTQTQIEGFKGGTISSGKVKNINDIVAYANNGTYERFALCRAHVEEAIAVASGGDVSTGSINSLSLFFWRTKGSSSPSKNAVMRFSQGGQDFYSLSEAFLANPNNPYQKP